VNLCIFSFFLCVIFSSSVFAQQTQTTTTTTNPQQTQQQQQGFQQGQQNTNINTLPANVQPTPQQQQQINQQFPSGFNLENVDPKDIPSEGVLRSFGLSEEQIKYALERKRAALKKGKSAVVVVPDTTNKSVQLGQRPKDKVVPVDSALIDSFGLIKTYPKGLIYGQDVFRNNKIQFYDRAQDVVAPDSYILGPGDEISVSAWGFADYSEVLVVDQNGYINPKPAGRIYVKGMNFKNSRALIQSKMGQFLDMGRSQMAITLTYSRVISVNIVGEVFNPGSYTIPAINTAFNALAVVGGPEQIGSVRNIYIKRDGKTVDTLDVYDYLLDPAGYSQTYLQDNDYIVVPVAGKTVSISGEVRREHGYELKEGEELLSLLSFAGGLKPTAYKSNIQVKRYQNSREYLFDINLDSMNSAGTDFELFDGDHIMVSRIPEGYYNNVTASGAVRIPGDYELQEGNRVTDLLEKTKGVLYDAYTQRAYILRLNQDLSKTYITINLAKVMEDANYSDNIVLQEFDELKVLSKKDFADDFIVTVLGTVRKPGEFPFGSGLSLKDVLFMAGGLKREAANNRIEVSRIVDFNEALNQMTPTRAIVYTVQVGNDLSLTSEAEEYSLQPFDQVFVRTNPDFEPPMNVYLTGEVFYPGQYSILSKEETVADIVKRAGGLRPYAFADGVTMNRVDVGNVYLDLDKALKNADSKHNLVLNEGDSIHIPKTMDLVFISGAVGNYYDHSISAPFFGKRAGYYVRNFAGGFSQDASRRKTYVIYPNGIMRKAKGFGVFNVYPRVKKGSQIKVMYKPKKADKAERKPVDWNRVIENTTLKITALLTVWLLITRVTQ
jgi:protein involved in polysaccharide export with SLBB domain